MTKPEFEWIAFNGGEAYVPKGAGPERRVASISRGEASVYVGNEMLLMTHKGVAEHAVAKIVAALATPASDGLPEGWKATEARRESDRAKVWFATFGTELRIVVDGKDYPLGDTATMSLSEACLAANERFPVAKPEAPAPKWVPIKSEFGGFRRVADGLRVANLSALQVWAVTIGHSIAAFPTAEEAMGWADRERPVA